MTDRGAWLVDAVTGLADVLDADFTVAAFSGRLAEELAQLLDPADVAVAIADDHGTLRVEGATSGRVFALASADLGNGQGPCTDCYRSGGPIRNHFLGGATDRWPQFGPMAREVGFRMAHAIPLRSRSSSIGVAGVLAEGADQLTDYHAGLAEALVTSAAIGLTQERALRRSTEKSEQLQHALDSRIVVEQAKGMVAARLNTNVDVAFTLLRDYARGRNERLAAVCDAVVQRKLPAAALVSARRAARRSSADRGAGRGAQRGADRGTVRGPDPGGRAGGPPGRVSPGAPPP